MGPRFGYSELTASESFNRDKGCRANANLSGYHIGMNSEGRNMLTNLKCEKKKLLMQTNFTISEIEVWEIIFNNELKKVN